MGKMGKMDKTLYCLHELKGQKRRERLCRSYVEAIPAPTSNQSIARCRSALSSETNEGSPCAGAVGVSCCLVHGSSGSSAVGSAIFKLLSPAMRSARRYKYSQPANKEKKKACHTLVRQRSSCRPGFKHGDDSLFPCNLLHTTIATAHVNPTRGNPS